MVKRDIAKCIIFNIITCGIYSLVWMAHLADDANELSGRKLNTSGGMVVLLTLVTCGIYGIFWRYQVGGVLDELHEHAGRPNQHFKWLIPLSIFFLPSIVDFAIIQYEFNNFIDSNICK